jgi:hypothetical protein
MADNQDWLADVVKERVVPGVMFGGLAWAFRLIPFLSIAPMAVWHAVGHAIMLLPVLAAGAFGWMKPPKKCELRTEISCDPFIGGGRVDCRPLIHRHFRGRPGCQLLALVVLSRRVRDHVRHLLRCRCIFIGQRWQGPHRDWQNCERANDGIEDAPAAGIVAGRGVRISWAPAFLPAHFLRAFFVDRQEFHQHHSNQARPVKAQRFGRRVNPLDDVTAQPDGDLLRAWRRGPAPSRSRG